MPRFKASNKSNKLEDVDKNVTGVLLVNLGTPEQPTSSAVRRYLREFLSDPRVVEIPRFIWLIILYCLVLPLRPAKSAKLYRSIWTKQGSPLLVTSIEQKKKLSAFLHKEQHEELDEKNKDDLVVDVAMRYGQPSISHVLSSFQQQGINKLVVLPLYPQYAAPTTGSVFDAVADELKQWRWVPELHFISSYHQHDLYIQALANSVTEHFTQFGQPDKLVLSYHGMPKLFQQRGDPYQDFCQKTTELLVKKLGLKSDDYVECFQSRFGRGEWLKPYTDETLKSLAAQGCNNIAVVSPAFSVDCLETLEELDKENREVFINAGGKEYRYIPALNTRDDHIKMMSDLVTRYL